MPRTTATEALAYATDDEMVRLYAVLVGAWILTVLGQFVSQGRGSITTLLGFLVVLVGVAGSLVAIVAIAYKVLADS